MTTTTQPRRRVAIAYDCLFPLTVGGAERWYRALTEELVAQGFVVTYLTRRQWEESPPEIPGVEIVAVSGRSELYDSEGVRRLGPTLAFGLGVLVHLLRHRSRYAAVHTANFPFWSVLASRAATVGTPTDLVVDWHEVWSRRYWRTYAGPVVGRVGYLIQRLCIAWSTYPVVTSALNAQRFREAGGRQAPTVLAGLVPTELGDHGSGGEPSPAADPPYVLFAGRHIADKGIDLIPDIASALASVDDGVRLVVAGDGPQRQRVEAEVVRRSLEGRVDFPGFVDHDHLRTMMAGAACVLVPSRREGYGIVVVEATSTGTPVVTVANDENLAAGHIVEGVNGYVADPPDAQAIAASIQRVIRAGPALRRSTLAWHRPMARASSIDRSLAQVVELHASLQTGTMTGNG